MRKINNDSINKLKCCNCGKIHGEHRFSNDACPGDAPDTYLDTSFDCIVYTESDLDEIEVKEWCIACGGTGGTASIGKCQFCFGHGYTTRTIKALKEQRG